MKKILILFITILSFSGVKAQDTVISKVKINPTWISPDEIFKPIDTTMSSSEKASVLADKTLLNELKGDYDNTSISEMKKSSIRISSLIQNSINEKDILVNNNSNKEAIRLKEILINSLIKEQKIIELSIIKEKLNSNEGILLSDKAKFKKYLIWSIIGFSILSLTLLILFQRSRIKSKNTEILTQLQILNKKNTYLEYAAKIIRHDMHSGINTYIPRGISSLERRLTPEVISNLKLESPLRLLKDGLTHTQKIYKGVYEFTNLVKKDATLNKETCDLKQILVDYLSGTSYVSQVNIEKLQTIEVNQALFCTAVDNLIRNGLKYNDSDSKFVNIFAEDEDYIIIQDNGRGMTQKEFENFSQPYIRKEGQAESGSGLGLNICVAILQEHKFEVSCEKNNIGTKMKIKIK